MLFSFIISVLGLLPLFSDWIINLYNRYPLILMPITFNPKKKSKSDNSILIVSATEQQIANIYNFCHNFQQYYEHFIMTCYKISPNSSLSSLIFLQNKEQLLSLFQEAKQEKYLLIDSITDFGNTYKGRVTWVMLGFTHKAYLIDVQTFHEEIREIQKIVEDPSIIKFAYRQCILLQDMKREWKCFGMNFFDFQIFQKGIGIKRKMNIHQNQLSVRPISMHLHDEMQQRYNNMIKYLSQIRYYLENESNNFSIYGYSNHYEHLLKEYRHIAYSYEQEEKQYLYLENEKARKMKEDKQNNYNPSNQIQTEQFKKIIMPKNDRQRSLCQMIINWREHIARIFDCPPKKLLNFEQILIIASEQPSSILQIQQIVALDKIEAFELASKIFELLTLQKQLHQNQINDLQMKNNRKNRQQKNIKSLLSQLKWQGREQWLNRKNDQSIRLYKQIVSIVELDNSIIQEFSEGLPKGNFSKVEIGRYVKYAEFLRNGNHKKLKEFYDSCPPLQSSADREEQLQFWCSDEEFQYVDHKNISISLTSIADSCQKLPDKNESNTLSSLKSPFSINSFSSDPELSLITGKLQPLPENIEEIYLKAVSVKKGYQKVQKKKGGRKQGRQDPDQFVPSWQQIKQLLQV